MKKQLSTGAKLSLLCIPVSLALAQVPDTLWVDRTEGAFLSPDPIVYMDFPAENLDIIWIADSSNVKVLRIESNGQIFWRERLVTTDSMLVAGLRDVVLSLCGERTEGAR